MTLASMKREQVRLMPLLGRRTIDFLIYAYELLMSWHLRFRQFPSNLDDVYVKKEKYEMQRSDENYVKVEFPAPEFEWPFDRNHHFAASSSTKQQTDKRALCYIIKCLYTVFFCKV